MQCLLESLCVTSSYAISIFVRSKLGKKSLIQSLHHSETADPEAQQVPCKWMGASVTLQSWESAFHEDRVFLIFLNTL